MISMLEPMLSEFRQEAVITKRVLDRVPADKLSWRPHPKSMSLGQLALHVASIPGNLAKLTQLDEFDASKANFNPAAPTDAEGNSRRLRRKHSIGRRLYLQYDRAESPRKLALAGPWKRGIQPASHRSHAVHHAEPLVPSSRPAIGLPAAARCPRASHIRSQRGRESIWMRSVEAALSRSNYFARRQDNRLFRQAEHQRVPSHFHRMGSRLDFLWARESIRGTHVGMSQHQPSRIRGARPAR